MTKYTKRQYLSDVAANEAALLQIKNELASYAAGENLLSIADAWNGAYDRQHDLKNERMDIERRWNTRNWTWQDHSFAELVAANVD